MVVMGCLGGAAWALIPGILRAFFKTSEILTSLLLNYVAGLLLTYLIFESQSYWRETKGFNATVFPTGKTLPPSAVWPSWTIDVQGGVTIPLGAVLAVLVAVVLWVLYKRTRFGFEAEVLGDSERAARYSGVRVRRKILAVMALSGAIAGLGGASQVGDFAHSVDGDPNGLQKLGYGYTGIVIAALARYNPFAVVLVAFLMGGLENAGNTLQGANFPAGLVGVIQGIILFSALGGEVLVRHRVRIVRTNRGGAATRAGARGVNNSLLIVLIASGIAYGTPLLYASLGELLAERSGVLNLGVEGMMLVGAVIGLLDRAAGPCERRHLPRGGHSRRGARGSGPGLDPCLSRDHAAGEPDRLRSRAHDLRRRRRAVVLPRQRPQRCGPAGRPHVPRRVPGEHAALAGRRADRVRSGRAGLHLVGLRDRDLALPLAHAARPERPLGRRVAGGCRHDGRSTSRRTGTHTRSPAARSPGSRARRSRSRSRRSG